MNLREGTRRLALLLGVVGAILGGFASYLVLQPALEQRARHNRFEQLANSDVVKQERRTLQAAPAKQYLDDNGNPIAAPKAASPARPAPGPAEQPNDWEDVPQGGPVVRQGPDGKTYNFPPGTNDAQIERYYRRHGIGPPDSEVNVGEVKTIHWTTGTDYGIASIETQDGQTLYPTPVPSAWLYVMVALFPIFGFFIPWGAVRAIGWVGAGFVAGGK
jgi:hypothetical protein